MSGNALSWIQNYVRKRDRMYEDLAARRLDLMNKRHRGEQPDEVELLQADVDQMKLTLACVLNVLLDKKMVSEEELLARAEEIDALDGKVDGKLRGQVKPDGAIAVEPREDSEELDRLADALDEEEGPQQQ
ncbi:MAG TPA: hypothetical protein VNA25_02760 [Phycisphaerae bacterium]|nr:hypothetical protein [Phycisphaerae bacterium]HUT56778.1 hypothetical protein [Phycisphaerae bacterium]